MLKQRLITAIILVPLVVWGVLALPTQVLALILAFIVALGAWEWAVLISLDTFMQRTAYVFFLLLVLFAAAWFVTIPYMLHAVLLLAVLWWLIALLSIQRYSTAAHAAQSNASNNSVNAMWSKGASGLIGILVLVPSWCALVALHQQGQFGAYLVLLLMVLIWGADSGAYFAGRRWGRRKLAPQVSPGKTWEGVIGGLSVALLVAIFGGVQFNLLWPVLVGFILLSLVTVLLSVVGDLLESMLKRQAGVKDSGTLLPGHGGVLDRIDSLTAAAPVFALGLLGLGLIQ